MKPATKKDFGKDEDMVGFWRDADGRRELFQALIVASTYVDDAGVFAYAIDPRSFFSAVKLLL